MREDETEGFEVLSNAPVFGRILRIWVQKNHNIINETVKGASRYTANHIQLLVFTARITIYTDTNPDRKAAAIPVTMQYQGVTIAVFNAS